MQTSLHQNTKYKKILQYRELLNLNHYFPTILTTCHPVSYIKRKQINQSNKDCNMVVCRKIVNFIFSAILIHCTVIRISHLHRMANSHKNKISF